MTIPAGQSGVSIYQGNGTADTFDIGFRITDASELSVEQTTDAGITSLLVLNTDYTVVGVDSDEGSITLVAGPLANGYTLTIEDAPEVSQVTQFRNQSSFFGVSHERVADKLTRLTRKLFGLSDRSLKIPLTASGVDTALPDPVAYSFLRVNEDATGFMQSSVTEIPSPTSDWVGFTDALLNEAGITPSGNPDTALSSERLKALKILANQWIVNSAANVDDMIAGTTISGETITHAEGQRWSSGATLWQILTGGIPVADVTSFAPMTAVSPWDYGWNPAPLADNTAALQAAIDACIYLGAKTHVVVPPGVITLSDTIHLGYGTGFSSVNVICSGMMYRSEGGNFSGTGFRVTFNDRPAFNFQGGRSSSLRECWVLGLHYDYIADNQLGSITGALNSIDDTVAANWIDPAFPASASSRYAPYTAITVDAYSGNRPGVSYPDVNYPAFLGAVSQYNKAFSSDCRLENVGVTGFVVGFANQPCDADGNGDFTVLKGVNMDHVVYAISIGNSQSRQFNPQNVVIGQCHTAITTRTHGKQLGQIGGEINNLSVSDCIDLLNISPAYTGPLTLNLYCESTWRIGTISVTGATGYAVIFDSCKLDFGNQSTATRGRPAKIVEGAGSDIDIIFNGGVITGFPSVANFGSGGNVSFNGTQISPTERSAGATDQYIAYAHNALSGGVVIDHYKKGASQKIKFTPVDLDTLANKSASHAQDYTVVSRRDTCIPHLVRNALPADNYSPPVYMPDRQLALDKGSEFSAFSITGRTLTATFNSRSEDTFALKGGDVGDVLIDQNTGTVFFIRSRTGLAIIAEAQNNIKNDGGWSLIDSVASTGLFWVISGRFYTTTYYLRGDLTAGNPLVSNCARDDGFHGNYDNEIAVNDWIWMNEFSDRFAGPADCKVTARDQAAGTITFSGNMAKTESAKRLGVFIRQAAANA